MTALPPPGAPGVSYLVDLSSWTRPAFEIAGPDAVLRSAASKLARLIIDRNPESLAFAVDIPGRTWHYDLWDGYHAGRTPPPIAYWDAVRELVKFIRLHHIPTVWSQGFSADDVLAALARMARAAGDRVVIVAGDHDLWQLVEPDDAVVVWDGRERVVGVSEVCAAYDAVGPEHLGDLFALAGQSDEAPGVPGIGLKTAAKLLRRYGGEAASPLEGVLRYGAMEGTKAGAALRDHADAARLGRRLVTLRADAPLQVGLSHRDLAVGWSDDDCTKIRERALALGITSAARGSA